MPPFVTGNKIVGLSFSGDHHHHIPKITNPFANWRTWPHSFIFSYIYKERKVLTSIHKKKMRATGKRLIIPPVGHVINVGHPITGVDRPPHAITNTISGTGGVVKNGTSPLIFTGPTTYTGDTTINGTSSIRVVAPADLSSSTNIIVNGGAFLTVTGMVSGTLPLASGHSLRGHGVMNGALTANAGSTVSPAVTPGVSAAGVLTVSNAIVLSGTTIIELDPANATNDVLKSGLSTITYGGNLSLTNLSSLSGGNSFKISS